MVLNITNRLIAVITSIIMALSTMTSDNVSTNNQQTHKIRFIQSNYSSQELNYIIYTPNNVNASTPILLFLHGDGDVNMTYAAELERYQFLARLKSGDWQPDFILVMPIGRKTGNWANEQQNINILLLEVINNFGGSASNMYIAGASAGSDGLTMIAQSLDFKGAIYMAGHLNGKKGKMSAKAVMKLWRDKKVYYYRDNLYRKGGYGYSKDFIQSCYDLAPTYNVSFNSIDLNWNHDYGLVDATFLPEKYLDDNGQHCHDAINKLLFQ